jgi:hypothetical protein
MTRPQEQLAELARRTQENFKHLWEQWNQRSTELMKAVGNRPASTTAAPGNPEEVLDAVFDFAENLIAQQRAFAKQMLRAAGSGQQATADADIATEAPTGPTPAPSSASAPSPTTIQGSTSPES